MLWAVEVLRAGPEGVDCRGSALAQVIVSSVLSGISGISRVSRVFRPSGASGVGEQAGRESTATAPSPASSVPTETTPRGALQTFFDCHRLRGLKGLRELSLLLLRRAVAGTLFETTVGLEGLTLRCEGVGPDRGALYASDVEHELIPTPEWKPGEEARPEAYSGVKLCAAVYSAEMLTGALVTKDVPEHGLGVCFISPGRRTSRGRSETFSRRKKAERMVGSWIRKPSIEKAIERTGLLKR